MYQIFEKKIQILKKQKKIKAIAAIDYGGCPQIGQSYKKFQKDKIILINDGCHSLWGIHQ